jgi:hypothetical protein
VVAVRTANVLPAYGQRVQSATFLFDHGALKSAHVTGASISRSNSNM